MYIIYLNLFVVAAQIFRGHKYFIRCQRLTRTTNYMYLYLLTCKMSS